MGVLEEMVAASPQPALIGCYNYYTLTLKVYEVKDFKPGMMEVVSAPYTGKSQVPQTPVLTPFCSSIGTGDQENIIGLNLYPILSSQELPERASLISVYCRGRTKHNTCNANFNANIYCPSIIVICSKKWDHSW